MEIVDSVDINYGLNVIDLIQMQNLAQLLVRPNWWKDMMMEECYIKSFTKYITNDEQVLFLSAILPIRYFSADIANVQRWDDVAVSV